MKAIISDIHSNWEALQAVLQDAARHGAREVYCLGDLIGYGPNPRECLDLIRYLEFPVVLMGNHDQAAIGQPHGFNPRAMEALNWTKKELFSPGPGPADGPEQRRRFLAQRPLTHQEGDFLYVHGSPRDPLHEYVYPEDASNARKMGEIFSRVTRYCFMGHTHIPGIFTPDLCFHSSEELSNGYRLNGDKILCNVGSVGQSRDGDARACYVLIENDVIQFRRIRYEMNVTAAKTRAIPQLDESMWLGEMREEAPSKRRRSRTTPLPATYAAKA